MLGKADRHALHQATAIGGRQPSPRAVGGAARRAHRAVDVGRVAAGDLLEDLAVRPVTVASIPFGSYDRHVLRRLREAGFTRVYSSDGGSARTDAWFQARTSLRGDLDAAWIAEVLADSATPALRARRVAARAVKRIRG